MVYVKVIPMNTCETVEFNWATSAPDFASSD